MDCWSMILLQSSPFNLLWILSYEVNPSISTPLQASQSPYYQEPEIDRSMHQGRYWFTRFQKNFIYDSRPCVMFLRLQYRWRLIFERCDHAIVIFKYKFITNKNVYLFMLNGQHPEFDLRIRITTMVISRCKFFHDPPLPRRLVDWWKNRRRFYIRTRKPWIIHRFANLLGLYISCISIQYKQDKKIKKITDKNLCFFLYVTEKFTYFFFHKRFFKKKKKEK